MYRPTLTTNLSKTKDRTNETEIDWATGMFLSRTQDTRSDSHSGLFTYLNYLQVYKSCTMYTSIYTTTTQNFLLAVGQTGQQEY